MKKSWRQDQNVLNRRMFPLEVFCCYFHKILKNFLQIALSLFY